MKYFSNHLAVAAVLLSCVGLLVFFQIIRPFRNPSVDGPLSLAAWGIGTVLAIIALFLPQKSRALCAVGIRFNVLPLFCALALLWYLRQAISPGIE
jgi:hypothetical protein